MTVLRTYGELAKARLAKIRSDEIEEFISKLPDRNLGHIYKPLKVPDGFRPGNTITIKNQTRQLVSRLSQVGGSRSDVDYKVFELVWKSFGVGILDLKEEMEEYETRLESIIDLDEKTDEIDFSDADMGFIKKVSKSSEKISREDFLEYLKFGPFEINDSVVASIERLKTSDEIKEHIALSEAPERIENLEEKSQTFEQQIRLLNQSVSWLNDHFRGIEKIRVDLDDLSSEIKNIVTRVKKESEKSKSIQDFVEDNAKKILSIEKTAEQTQYKISTTKEELLDRVNNDNAGLLSRIENLETSLSELRALKDAVEELSSSDEDVLGSEVIQLDQIQAQIDNLNKKVTTSESGFNQPALSPIDCYETDVDPIQISSVEELGAALLNLVNSLGIKKNWAKPIAIILGSCLISQKALLVGGSQSRFTAREIAQNLGKYHFEVLTSLGEIQSKPLYNIDFPSNVVSPFLVKSINLAQVDVAYPDIVDILEKANFVGPYEDWNGFPIATVGKEGLFLPVDFDLLKNSFSLDLDKVPRKSISHSNPIELKINDLKAIHNQLSEIQIPSLYRDILHEIPVTTASCFESLKSDYKSLRFVAGSLYDTEESRFVAMELLLVSACFPRYYRSVEEFSSKFSAIVEEYALEDELTHLSQEFVLE